MDTNVLVRALLDEGKETGQAQAARKVLRSQTVFISLVTLAETVWVLLRTYKRPRAEITQVVQTLADSPNIVLQRKDSVQQAIRDHEKHGGDLADHIIARLGHAAGCTTTLTFDVRAARSDAFTKLTP